MPWEKGETGNPGGRRKRSPGTIDMVRKARDHVPKAIETAAALLDAVTVDGAADGKTRMAAATFLRDTGIGKPSQVEFDLAQVSDDELAAEVTRRAGLRRADEERSGVAAAALDSH